MTLLEEVRREYRRQVDEHYDENREAALKIRDILAASPVNYNGVFDKTVHIPKVYDRRSPARPTAFSKRSSPRTRPTPHTGSCSRSRRNSKS